MHRVWAFLWFSRVFISWGDKIYREILELMEIMFTVNGLKS